MAQEIYGQGITFNPKGCEDYCMPLYGAGGCNDGCGDAYIKNNTLLGNPLDYWNITAGLQLSSQLFVTDLSSEFTIDQSVTIPADEYVLFYSFDSSINFDCELTITNGPTSEQLFDTSGGDESTGYTTVTLTGSSSRTIQLAFTTTLPTRTIVPGYIYLCPKEAYIPYTDFCFQMPLTETGDNLLDDASINNGVVGLQAEIVGSFTGEVSDQGTSVSCGTLEEATIEEDHAPATNGEDGYYFFKYSFDSVTVTYGEVDGVSEQGLLVYTLDLGADPPEVLCPINSDVTSGAVVSSEEIIPSTAGYFDTYFRTWTEADGSGTCRYNYSVENLESSIWKMWQEDTATLDDDTFYRLTFTNKNATGVTVKIYDESSTLIFQSSSNGISFDKIFNSGTLPGSNEVTIRFEFTAFIDYETENWNDTILTNAELKKQCTYTVEIQDETETALFDLTEDHSTVSESSGTSYAKNIEYCLDTNALSAGTYSMVVYDDCDTNDQGERSSKFSICDGLIGYKQISWIPSANKIVGDYVLDYTSYPANKFLWIRCDIQDLDIQNEREFYTQSNGFINVPWSRVRNLYTLVVFPVPRHVREALSLAFQDTFYIDGEAYQVIDEDAYSPLFQANYNNAMRITVHKVGEFSISRNA